MDNNNPFRLDLGAGSDPKEARQRVRVTVLGHVSRQTLASSSLADDAAILRARGLTIGSIALALGVNERTIRRALQ